MLEVRRTRVITQEKAVVEAELELARLRSGATAEEIKAAEEALAGRTARLALTRLGEKDIAALEAERTVREAELREAEAQLKLTEAARAAVAVAEARTRAAEAELKMADAETKGCHAALESRDFTSPVNGVVTRTFVRVGEVCRKGIPCILVADDTTPRWVEAFVREADAMLVNVGQPARVRVPANVGHYVDGVVEQVGLHTDAQDLGESGAGSAAPYGRPGRVWVRIRPLHPLPGEPVIGTSARAVIRVR